MFEVLEVGEKMDQRERKVGLGIEVPEVRHSSGGCIRVRRTGVEDLDVLPYVRRRID